MTSSPTPTEIDSGEGSGGDAIASPEALTKEQSEISTDAGGNDDTVAALVGTELNLAEGMISNHVTLSLKSSFDAHCFIKQLMQIGTTHHLQDMFSWHQELLCLETLRMP